MSWFSKKSSTDTKARIEELKKKIQAEQSAYSQSVSLPPTPVAPPPPAAAPAPIPAQDSLQYAPPPVASVAAAEQPVPSPISQVVITRDPAPGQYSPRETARTHQSRDGGRAHHPRAEHREPQQTQERSADSWREPQRAREQHSAPQHDAGVVLDLGEGMSLNLPIRSRMQLDDFLAVAQRVRELQRLERTH